ncbi:MAG: chemotaxis protein CheB [Pseudomonadota bacterium]
MPSTDRHQEVLVALLYAQQGLQPHLKDALDRLGARVVYDAAAARFDRSMLDASGAQVVLVNLEPEADEEIDALGTLLADGAMRLVFNDAEVSSRLQGWDQARWARHLAAKIRGGGDLDPPRPPGAQPVPARNSAQPARRRGGGAQVIPFRLEGEELDRAMAADTAESLRRTRAALVTPEEPITPELVDPHARQPSRHDATTLVLPRADLERALIAEPPSHRDAPTLELGGEAVSAAGAAAAVDLQRNPEFAQTLRDFGLVDAAPATGDPADPPAMRFTAEFDEAHGALQSGVLEDDPTPSQRETPPAGLDDLLLDVSAPVIPPPAPAPRGQSPQPAVRARSLDEFEFAGLSLEPLPGDEGAAAPPEPITGRAHFTIDENERNTAVLEPVADAPPVVVEDFDPGALIDYVPSTPPPSRSGTRPAPPPAVPEAEEGVRNVWVLGASIGGPEAVREFLAALPADVPALFLLAQHMGADFFDLMVQQLARASRLPVRTVLDGDVCRHGSVLVVPLAERLLLEPDGRVSVQAADEPSPYRPSIDRVLRDIADRFGRTSGAIVFSGMARDAVAGAIHMRDCGGTVWVQDPATCVISSMVDGAQDAGVVSFVGSPAELAQEFVAEMARRAAAATAWSAP